MIVNNYKKQWLAVLNDSIQQQKNVFDTLIQKNKQSLYGKFYQFEHIQNYSDFAQKLPLTEYEDIFRFLDEQNIDNNPLSINKIDWFALTSGTTSAKKKIPVSQSFLSNNHYSVSRLALYHLTFHLGCDWMIHAKSFGLSGYNYLETYGGKAIKDISAILLEELPLLIKYFNFPNKTFTSWDEKMDFILKNGKDLDKISLISGVPTWMLVLFENCATYHQKDIKDIFKNLKLIVHGGVNFENYKTIFRNIFEDRDLQFFETFNATEGFFAFQYAKNHPELLLITNAEIFYEFRPLDSDRAIPLWEIEKNKEYELIISTFDGLYRYKTGDTLAFSQLNPYLFTITGRTNEYVNAFGEHLTIFHVNQALKNLSQTHTFTFRDFFIVPLYPENGRKGRHEWHIEFDEIPFDLSEIKAKLDAELTQLNTSYCQKRENNIGMEALEIVPIKKGTIAEILAQKHQIGGQVKQKKLYNDRKIMDLLAKHHFCNHQNSSCL